MIIIALLLILPFSGCAHKNPVSPIQLTLTFDPPERGIIMNYKMYSGNKSRIYSDTTNLGVTFEHIFFEKFSPGFYTVTAIDTFGRESKFGNEAVVQ